MTAIVSPPPVVAQGTAPSAIAAVVAATALTTASFRTTFPAFADAAAYPDASIGFWLLLGQKLMNAALWGDLYEQGLYLYVAHNITLDALTQLQISKGLLGGLTTGIENSKSVGPVSIGVDLSSVTIEGAGAWNLTQFGVRYYQLMNLVGMGGSQL